MKKETKVILDHEIALVRWYKDYLEFLDQTAKGELYFHDFNHYLVLNFDLSHIYFS